MKKRIYILLLALTLPLMGLNAQLSSPEDNKELPHFTWSHHKEIGLNFTPLISTLIPFNLGETKAGFTSFSYKRYGRKIGLRINTGIEFDRDDFEDGFALLTIGFERRRQIGKKITFVNGLDTGLFGFFDDTPFFNISAFYGFEYNFTDTFFAAAEGNIQFLFGDGAQINVNPPVAIFFFVRID